MKRLLRGERTGGVLTFAGVGAVIALLVASLSQTWSYRSQAHDFQKTLYDRCVTRLHYDQANHASIGADVSLYRTLLKQNAQVPESAIPPEFRDLARQQKVTIQKALAEKEKAFNAGVPSGCDEIKK